MTVQEKLKLLKEGFTKEQIAEIQAGEEQYIDTSYYAKKEFIALQMKEIRLGMEEGLEIELYARPSFDWLQMEQIRLGLEQDLNVKKYAFPKIPHDVMRELRHGLAEGIDLAAYAGYPADVIREVRYAKKSGVDINEYVKRKNDAEQLEQIRLALESGVPIRNYINDDYRGISYQEIRIGLENNVNVSLYANIAYNWRQMREIRLGLEHQVDTKAYLNPMYDWKQMQQIREGLEEGLNVDYYKNLMYTATEMKRRRQFMLENMSDEFIGNNLPVIVDADNYSISISGDKYTAKIKMIEPDRKVSIKAIIKLLRDRGIVYGIKDDVVREIASGDFVGVEKVVAEGTRPQKGKDGYYEYLFKTTFSRTPRVLEDGSLDYTDVEWFEQAYNGQKLAIYHEPEGGVEGHTVTGEIIGTTGGKPLSRLHGKGVIYNEEENIYYAEKSGLIEFKASTSSLSVNDLLQLKELTYSQGKINFDGSVQVKGNVTDGAYLHATRDIIIDGMVEGADIKAGGSILIRKGVNAANKGSIVADSDITASFFEYARVQAKGSVNSNYLLNSVVSSGEKIEIAGGKGSIIGGFSYAAKEIKVTSVGNEAMIKTLLKLGLNDDMVKKRVNVENQLKTLDTEIMSLKNVLKQLNETLNDEARNENETYLKVENAIYVKEESKVRLYEEQEKVMALIRETESARAVILGRAFENVSVEINGLKWLTSYMGGPTGGRYTSNVIIRIVNDEIEVQNGR